MNINNGANALQSTNTNTKFQKFEIKDFNKLVAELKSIMPTDKNTIIFNIAKYGFEKQQEQILELLGYSTKTKSKTKVSKAVIEQAQIFDVLFDVQKDCFISLMNKETGQMRSYNVQVLKDPYRLQAILKSQYFDNMKDMMYSLNAYNNMYKHTKDTLFSLQNFAYDVDFDTDKYTIKQVIEIVKDLYMKDKLPVPNAIEYGHRLRLIYSVEDVPVTKKSVRLLEKISIEINNMLPKDLNSSVQPLTTFCRLIGSVNTKNSSVIKVEVLNPKKYVLKELQEAYLESPDWLKKVKKANSKVIGIQNTYTLNLARIRDLEKIQRIREDGYKEYLCYLYRNYCLLSGMNENEAWEKTQEFNSKFKKPKRINKLNGETKSLNRKQYLHKSETILELLNITQEDEINLGLETIISQTEYKRRQNKAFKKRYYEKLKSEGKISRNEKNLILRQKIKSLLAEGFKQKDIALQLELGIATVKRHIKYLKENGLI